MSLLHTHEKCSLCHKSLGRWNASTCIRCGGKLCSHHTHLMHVPHSYVLVSVCDHCTAHALPKMYAAAKTSAPLPTT